MELRVLPITDKADKTALRHCSLVNFNIHAKKFIIITVYLQENACQPMQQQLKVPTIILNHV